MAGHYIERRKKEDVWTKLLHNILVPYTYFIVTLCFILIIIGSARRELSPESEAATEGHFWAAISERSVLFVFCVMVFSLALSIVGMVINAIRSRRRHDDSQLAVLILGLMAIVGMLISLGSL